MLSQILSATVILAEQRKPAMSGWQCENAACVVDFVPIQRFVLVVGPVSSLFDFLTFHTLLHFFGAGEALFHTGWFMESLATQGAGHRHDPDPPQPVA